MREYVLKPFHPNQNHALPWQRANKLPPSGMAVSLRDSAPRHSDTLKESPSSFRFGRSLNDENLPYAMSKSQVAYMMTCQKLFKEYPKMYFWTFTFVDVWHDWQYSTLWMRIMTEIQNHFGREVYGVRVIEAHQMHGLHYHALLTVRLPVEVIRRIGRKHGLGRIHVEKCNHGAAFYIAKYLTTDDTKLYGRMQRWHTVGGYKGVRKNDIEVISNGTRCLKEFTRHCGQLPFRISRLIYTYGSQFGKVKSWDFKTCRLFEKQLCATLKREQSDLYLKMRGVLYDETFAKWDYCREDNGWTRKPTFDQYCEDAKLPDEYGNEPYALDSSHPF